MVIVIAKKQPSKKSVEPSQDYVQPQLNIGLVGHVDHGKTTLTEALSGRWTDTHSEEIKKGITIRLGYADFSIYADSSKEGPDAYSLSASENAKLLAKISLVDAPGHESLMATMLSGAAIFDGALLLVAANEPCPQPQTREHLVALQIIGVKKVVVVQNKIDLVPPEAARENYGQIKAFLKGTEFENSPIIPVSAQRKVNVDALLQAIVENIPVPEKNKDADPIMFVARSFDINRPGAGFSGMVGGIMGGTLKQGSLRAGDEAELRPGLAVEKKGKFIWQPILTKISALKAGGAEVPEVMPGGSIGVLTTLDPGIVKADAFAGNILGKPGKLPPVWNDLVLEIHLLERVVGAKDDLVVEPLKLKENLMLNVNSAATVGMITSLKKNQMSCALKIPVCAEKGGRVTISRLLGSRWRLIGFGIIK